MFLCRFNILLAAGQIFSLSKNSKSARIYVEVNQTECLLSSYILLYVINTSFAIVLSTFSICFPRQLHVVNSSNRAIVLCEYLITLNIHWLHANVRLPAENLMNRHKSPTFH